MPVIAHNHDWSAGPSGYQCLNCSAFVPDARIAATTIPPQDGVTGPPNAGVDFTWRTTMSGA